MRTSRWAWLGTSEDAQGEPIAPLGHEPPEDAAADLGPDAVTSFLGWPVFANEAIPATLGPGTPGTQDTIIACRPSDVPLWESVPSLNVFTEAPSGSLGARIQLRGYAAALTGRYPTGIGSLQGTGMVVQAGWS